MKNTIRYLKIFLLLSKYSLTSVLQGRIAILLFTLGKLIRFFMFFFFIAYLLQNTSAIKGYTTNQALIFFLTFNIIDSISQAFFREVYRFRQLVVSGELNTILVKPYPVLLRVLLGGVDPMDIGISFGYIAMVIYYMQVTDVFTTISVVSYVLLIMNSLVIATAFHIIVLGFGIISADVDHGILIYRDITSAGRFPLEIYKEPLRSMLTFVVPVGIMMSFPAEALFGKLSLFEALLGILVSFGGLGLSLLLWRSALKKYQSWGG